jgi:predicted NAD/FAD-binding protein
MRIAIVGAGVSGLVAAHLLHAAHDVTLFEAGDYAGGHTHTVRVETEGGVHDVDTGFIVHNDRNYPCFRRLLERLRVATQPTEMSFSVSDAVGDFEYSGRSPNGLYAKRSHLLSPAFQRMVAELVRFNREAHALLGSDADGPSLRDYLQDGGYSRMFVERLIVPQAAAVWSADPGQMWSFPARFLVEFFDNHGMLGFRNRPQWLAIRGGSHRYVEAIARPLGERLRLSTPIRAIARHPDHVELAPAAGEPERFDHVVIATHSDQALRMLTDASERERELLGAFPYQCNDVVLHTDCGLLPRRRCAWASWNYHLLEREIGRPTVTYHMNRLQSLRADRDFCVTLNRSEAIRSEHVIARYRYDHPVYTAAGVAAQRRCTELDGVARTSYCGAYWGYGFHEDGVVSALRACERFGVSLS